ncbi:hypothetical protein KJ853_00950 [Patescibacteria group bacterium]|nr:hypothetical protein [Patescibacteria group bacterium]
MKSFETGVGKPEPESSKLTRERLAEMQTLEVEMKADFESSLQTIREATGANLQPRPGGYHLTIVGPTEYKALAKLDDATITELQEISKQVQNGEGITVKGIGFIDGASSKLKLREVDKTKKTAFLALDIPALQVIREKIGLPPRDFHITLGFEGGDIHTQIVGQEPVKPNSPKMKDVTALIPKQADPRFEAIPLPDIHYGELDGQMKQRK